MLVIVRFIAQIAVSILVCNAVEVDWNEEWSMLTFILSFPPIFSVISYEICDGGEMQKVRRNVWRNETHAITCFAFGTGWKLLFFFKKEIRNQEELVWIFCLKTSSECNTSAIVLWLLGLFVFQCGATIHKCDKSRWESSTCDLNLVTSFLTYVSAWMANAST